MLSVEDLRHERDNPRAAYLLFLLNDAKLPHKIHAFVEGHNDLSFYPNFIYSFIQDPSDFYYPPYVCGDKENVYKAYNLIMKENPQGIPLFFVDKDLSDILNEQCIQASNIYMTDYYSIENYLVNEYMLLRVWTEIFHFTELIVEFNEVYRNKFAIELNRFYQFVLPFIAWGICLRRKGLRPNLKNIHFSDFFIIKEDLTLEKNEKAKRLGDIKLLDQICGTITHQDYLPEINSILNDLSKLAPKKIINGKLELGFFVAYLRELIKHLNKEISSVKNGGRVLTQTDIQEHNVVEILGSRVSIPDSLQKFFQENIAQT